MSGFKAILMHFIINLPSLQEQPSRFRKATIYSSQI